MANTAFEQIDQEQSSGDVVIDEPLQYEFIDEQPDQQQVHPNIIEIINNAPEEEKRSLLEYLKEVGKITMETCKNVVRVFTKERVPGPLEGQEKPHVSLDEINKLEEKLSWVYQFRDNAFEHRNDFDKNWEVIRDGFDVGYIYINHQERKIMFAVKGTDDFVDMGKNLCLSRRKRANPDSRSKLAAERIKYDVAEGFGLPSERMYQQMITRLINNILNLQGEDLINFLTFTGESQEKIDYLRSLADQNPGESVEYNAILRNEVLNLLRSYEWEGVGHSRGGAITSIIAGYLAAAYKDIHPEDTEKKTCVNYVTFGAPKPEGSEHIQEMNQLSAEGFLKGKRVINIHDGVTDVPTDQDFGAHGELIILKPFNGNRGFIGNHTRYHEFLNEVKIDLRVEREKSEMYIKEMLGEEFFQKFIRMKQEYLKILDIEAKIDPDQVSEKFSIFLALLGANKNEQSFRLFNNCHCQNPENFDSYKLLQALNNVISPKLRLSEEDETIDKRVHKIISINQNGDYTINLSAKDKGELPIAA